MTAEALIEQVMAGSKVPHLREQLLGVDDLDTLPSARPMVAGLLYTNTIAQLAGEPGSFKSFIGIGIACAVATGQPWCGHPVTEPGNVVYVAAEGAAGLQVRLKAWCEVNDVPVEQLRGRLHVLPRPVQLGDVVEMLQGCDVARETQAALLVLDTRARCTLGLAENDATEQGRAVHHLERIQQATESTVLSLHHSGRSGGHGRGSNAWDGAVWSDLRLDRDKSFCTISCHKHKDAPDGCKHGYRVVRHIVSEHLMPQRDAESDEKWMKRRSTLVVVQSGIPADPALGRGSVKAVLDIVWTEAPAEGLTAAEIIVFAEASGVGRSSVFTALKALCEAGKVIQDDTHKPTRYLKAETAGKP